MPLKKLTREEALELQQQGYVVSEGQEVLLADGAKPSVGGVAVRSAAASALPTLAGGAGFAGGMALGGALAPATGGLSLAIPLVMGMGGALGASKLAAKGQEALLPDSVKQTLTEDYQARPVASTLGGLATLPLGGFNPGKLGQIGAGLSGMGKVIARPAINLPLSIAEKQAAINMGAGGTIGAVQEGVMQPLEGREFDPASIALNAMIGGTFIRPNAIGRKLGFRGIPERTVDDPDQLSRTVGQHVEPEPVHELRQPTVNFTETQMEAMRRSTGLKQSGEVESQKVNIKTGEEIAEKPKLVKSAKTSAKAMEKALSEDAPVLSRETDPDILNVLVKQGRLVEKPVEGEAPKLPGISSTLAEEVAGGLKGKGLSTSPSEQYVATLAQEVMAEQNIKVSLDGNLTSADGAPLKGTALLPNSVREVVLNPKLATLDTLPHEGLHYFRTELEGRSRSGDAEAQRLLTKWDEVSAEGLADYNQRRSVAGLKPVDAHEFAVSENGLEFVKQQFNLNKEGGMQKWWNDTKALFKEKYSKNATVEDLRRAINFRFVNEQTKGQFVGAAHGDQPAGEGLTPQDERSLRLGKKGEGRTPYPFSEKERVASEQIIEQVADDDSMLDKASELPGYTGIPDGAPLDNPYQRNQGADEGLVTKAEKMLRNPEANKLPFNKIGVANGNQLLGSLKNQLAPAEWDMLKQAGIEKYLEGRVISRDEMAKWVKENGPKVEIHSYGMEGKVSEAKREYDRMTHEWYEKLTPNQRGEVQGALIPEDLVKQDYSPEDYATAQKYIKLQQVVRKESRDTSPRATSAYDTVSAFNTREPMPEWTTSKEGRNVQRVDVVVPQREVKSSDNYETRLKAETHREGANKGKMMEATLWQPDNLHENLPNTLGWAMIQYKTGPKGEKIAVVVEAQSRWGQEVKKEAKRAEKLGGRSMYATDKGIQDHPLLRDYNRLILKAAIEQARKEGATHIVVSDAESAMMSEGHDAHLIYHVMSNGQNLTPTGMTEYAAKSYYKEWKKYNPDKSAKIVPVVTQEPGMRLNYDTLLPRIAEELTGSKGERVSLGEHKNAFETDLDRSNYHAGEIKKQRSNLIFRNADGTPKTDVSGLMFPLQKIAAKLDSGDQFTLFNKHQGEGEGLARTDPSAKSFLPGLASALDKVEQKVSAPIAQAGRNWASRRDSYTGKMQIALSDLEKLNDKIVDSAMRKMRMVFRGEVEKPPSMSAEELQAVQILRDYYTWNVEERIANGQMIEGREAGKNPYYVPDTMNEQARYTLLETPNSPEARYLKKVWADYVMRESEGKLKREEVVNNINGYVDAMGSKDRHYTSINFGAARKAQGYGMPEVMRETSAKRALVSYGRRAANDMAFFKEIESNRSIAAALMIKDPDTGKLPALKEGDQTFHTTQEVKNMMSWITGGVNENSIRHPFITSASRLTNNLLLGAPTGLRDLAQVPVFNVPYMNKWSDLGRFVKGVLNFQKESRNALEYAARQPQIDKLAFNEISSSPNRLLSAIQKAATFARKGQGREALENLSRNISFSIGKEFARGNVLGAKAGHAPSKKFLERFGTLVEGDVTKMEGPALEHALNQIAKNVVDATQGTYGPAGLPNFTSEGQLAPFLALTKWSVEKSNTIFKDVVKPFYTGENRIPLLTYTLGSVLTGAGIQQLNEALSGKKGSDPMLDEALAKGDAEAISLQLATLMQLGTYMGIVGDSMKIATDVYKGKTPRNPLSFPLYSSAINSADMIADAMGAIQEGEDPVDILYHLSLDLMSQNVQNARVVLNRVEGEETARKESFRDVRVFEELEGKKGTDIPKVNRYKGMEAKEFKREKDLGKSAQMIPGLVSKAKGEAESLEELRMKLQSLKQNNYQTFPNPKTQPEAFKKYYQFLAKTQGETEAKKRLASYLRQNQVNRVKSQLVPSL